MGLLLCLLLGLGVPAMEPPESAEVCGRCHRAIQEAWAQSVHAHAMDSRLFQDALDLAESEIGPATRRTCLSCHAPVAARIGDLSLRRKVSWEGVTCDYCHSIQDVSLAGVNPTAKVQFSLVKSGPLKDAESNGHATLFSPMHTSSLVCASCHEYKNAQGFAVLTTYTEWKGSQAAREGKPCQSCHMFQVAGKVVDPRVKRSEGALVNLHQMPGSHSIDQLNKTIGANLSSSRDGDQLRVTLDVTNKGAGHFVPTGSPLRQIILELSVDDYSGHHFREERLYRRVVADQQGVELKHEHLTMVKSAKTLSDTRLGPGEKRAEVFNVPLARGVQAQVKATFWYYYSPLAPASQQRVTFLTLQRLVN